MKNFINAKSGYSADQAYYTAVAIDTFYNSLNRDITDDEATQYAELIALVESKVTTDASVYNKVRNYVTAVTYGNYLPGTMAWETWNPIAAIKNYLEDNKWSIIIISGVALVGIGGFLYFKTNNKYKDYKIKESQYKQLKG
jgi:hypothetical protein